MKNILINYLREQQEVQRKKALTESEGDTIKCPNCDADMELGGVCPECGYKDPSEVPEEDSLEEETEGEGCPYSEKLDFLVKDEEEAIRGYDEAIILFNGLDSADRETFIDKLNHIKDEELEHIDELETLKKILTGGATNVEDEVPEEPTVEEPVEANVEEPVEDDVEEVEDMEVIQESLTEEDEIYTLLSNKTFQSYEDVEALLKKEGYEVTEVFREGSGFNMSAMKDGTEYYIPFANGDKGYFAVLDSSLSEGKLGDWFASKVATVIDKATGAIEKGRRINFMKEFAVTLDKVLDGFRCEVSGDAININPDKGYVAKVSVADDGSLAIQNAEGKKATLDPKKLDDGLSAVGLKVKANVVPAVDSSDTSGSEGDDNEEELSSIGKRLKELGVTPEKLADMMK